MFDISLVIKFLIIIILVIIVYDIFIKNKIIEGNEGSGENDYNGETMKRYEDINKYYKIRNDGQDLDIGGNNNINRWVDYDSKSNSLVPIPGSYLKDKSVSRSIEKCQSLKQCKDLIQNPECGYCHYDDPLKRFYDLSYNGKPATNTCDGGIWTNQEKVCEDKVADTVCAKVEDCGDMYGDAADMCGYCPQTGKAHPVERENGILKFNHKKMLIPRSDLNVSCDFGDPTLNNTLLPFNNCNSFLDNNPCVTDKLKTGPHNDKCLKTLWEKEGCKASTAPTTSTINDPNLEFKIKNEGKFTAIGTAFQNIFKNATESDDLNTAIENSMLCFGNTDNVTKCASNFYVDYSDGGSGVKRPSSLCLFDKIADTAGCDSDETKQGSAAQILNSNNDANVNNLLNTIKGVIPSNSKTPELNVVTPEGYVKYMTELYNLSNGDGLYGYDYEKRKSASLICSGVVLPEREDIKNGDKVFTVVRMDNLTLKIPKKSLIADLGFSGEENKTLNGNFLYEGIVTDTSEVNKIKDNILWVKISGIDDRDIEISRDIFIKDADKQTKYFGWIGRLPTESKIKFQSEWDSIEKLQWKSCCAEWVSGCKETCSGNMNLAMYKYKTPINCILGDRGKWEEDDQTGIGLWSTYINKWNNKNYGKVEGVDWAKSVCSKKGDFTVSGNLRVDCGGGIQMQKKDVLYEERNDGTCPSLSSESRTRINITCNTGKCPQDGLHDADGLYYKMHGGNNGSGVKHYQRKQPNSVLYKDSKGNPKTLYWNDNNKKKKGSLMAAYNQCDGASNCVGIAEGDNSYFYFLKTSGSKTVGGNEGKFKNGVYIKCHQGINDYDNCQ